MSSEPVITQFFLGTNFADRTGRSHTCNKTQTVVLKIIYSYKFLSLGPKEICMNKFFVGYLHSYYVDPQKIYINCVFAYFENIRFQKLLQLHHDRVA